MKYVVTLHSLNRVSLIDFSLFVGLCHVWMYAPDLFNFKWFLDKQRTYWNYYSFLFWIHFFNYILIRFRFSCPLRFSGKYHPVIFNITTYFYVLISNCSYLRWDLSLNSKSSSASRKYRIFVLQLKFWHLFRCSFC